MMPPQMFLCGSVAFSLFPLPVPVAKTELLFLNEPPVTILQRIENVQWAAGDTEDNFSAAAQRLPPRDMLGSRLLTEELRQGAPSWQCAPGSSFSHWPGKSRLAATAH